MHVIVTATEYGCSQNLHRAKTLKWLSHKLEIFASDQSLKDIDLGEMRKFILRVVNLAGIEFKFKEGKERKGAPLFKNERKKERKESAKRMSALSFYQHGLIWLSYYIHYKMWHEITYLFPNFNGCNVVVWEWISNLIPPFTWHVITYSCCDKS